MAAFYGILKGGRGEVTRAGSKQSGIQATIKDFDHAVETQLYESQGKTFVSVGVRDLKTDKFRSLYAGPLSGAFDHAK